MNKLDFPNVDAAGMVFCGYPREWFDDVMKRENPVDYQKWADLMESLFFSGGTLPINEQLDKDYVSRGIRILKAVMGSFEPKHEHKEKVCALILKAICDEA
jgi:hypothetical protein